MSIFTYIYICIYIHDVVGVEATREGERRRGGGGERRMLGRGNKDHDVCKYSMFKIGLLQSVISLLQSIAISCSLFQSLCK